MPENVNTTQTGKSDASTQSNPVIEAAQGVNPFSAHQAAPGPVIPQSMPEQEGTKEERQAKAQALNKE